jgi:hypothetical protein
MDANTLLLLFADIITSGKLSGNGLWKVWQRKV